MVNYQQPIRGGLVNLGGTKSHFQAILGVLFFPSLSSYLLWLHSFYFFYVETHGNTKGGGTHEFLIPRIGLLGGGME